MSKGDFDDLSGQGKPLVFEDESWIPEDLRIAYRCLKNAGYIPPELELRKEIVSLKDLLSDIDNDRERLKRLKVLNFKIMQLNMMKGKTISIDDEYKIMANLLFNKKCS